MRCREKDSSASVIEQVLAARGIDTELIKQWRTVRFEDDSFLDSHLLGEDNLDSASKLLMSAIKSNHRIAVVVDCDVDGYTSSSILCSYLWERFGFSNIQPIFHRGKEHGLSDTIDRIEENVHLVILPDAGTNDIEQHKILCDRGVSVICLDHHEQDVESEFAVIINNQVCEHPSKAMTGAAVTWMFIRYFNDEYLKVVPWGDTSEFNVEKYLDLAALGCLSDMADFRDPCVRYIVHNGLSNINNPFFVSMCDKQKYSMDKMGGLVYMACAFYVTPYMNAVCRTGTIEEKEMMFKAMTAPFNKECVSSTKRGQVGDIVSIVSESVYRVGKAKERQTDTQNASLLYIDSLIEENDLCNNSVIVACCDPDAVDPAVCGLVANKLQAKYQRPVMVLRKIGDVYKGSARNYSMSEIEDFKDLCMSSGLFSLCAGHAGAFGSELPEENLEAFLEYANEQYSGVSKDPVYWIDYLFRDRDFKSHYASRVIDSIAKMKSYWGQQIPEAKVGIRISLTDPDDIELIGKNKNTIKMYIDGIDVIKFQSNQMEYEMLQNASDGEHCLIAYCTCGLNEFNGKVTPQLIVEDWYVEEDLEF